VLFKLCSQILGEFYDFETFCYNLLGSLEGETQFEARKTIPSHPNLPVRGKDPHASIKSCITLFPCLTIVFGRYLNVGTGIEPQPFCFLATVSLQSESPSP